MNSNPEVFYSERLKRLNIPDEDLQRYIHRIRTTSGISHELCTSSSNQGSQTWTQYGHARASGFDQDTENEANPVRDRVRVNRPGKDLSREAGTLSFSRVVSTAGEMTGAKEVTRSECDNAHPHGLPSLVEHLPKADNPRDEATDIEDKNTKGEDVGSMVCLEASRHHHDSLPYVVSNSREEFQAQSPQLGTTGYVGTAHSTPPEQTPHVSNDIDSPPTSPIEDASEMMEYEPELRVNDPGSFHGAVRRRLERAPVKHGKFIKLGSKVNPIRIAPETVLGKESSDGDDSSIIVDSSSWPSSPPVDAVELGGTVVTSTGASRSMAETAGKRVARKRVKVKTKQMLPEEFSKLLMEKSRADLQSAAQRKCIQSLAGMNIYYTGGDMHYATERTRSRMEIVVRHGGNLIPRFDGSTVTHIVTDAQEKPTLRALGLKALNDIPDHIPTVKWSWIVSGIGRASRNTEGTMMDEVWLHAAFSERIDAGPPQEHSTLMSKTRDKDLDTNELSRISEFSTPDSRGQQGGKISNEDISDLSAAPLRSSDLQEDQAADVQDPLAMFYVKAKAEIESERNNLEDGDLGGESDCSRSGPPEKVSLPKRGWTCDKREEKTSCANQDIIDKLQELLEIHKARLGDEDRWRAFSYSKCIRTLRSYPHRIKTLNEARSIRGIGEKTALKIMEIIETGQLRRIAYENTDDIKITRLFQGVYGAGPSVAYRWYASGCRTLEDLLEGHKGVKLNSVQEIGVKFYNDINSRMPRDEAKAIFDLIKPIALQLDPKLYVEIMGSFRRGKADCGDIDILITRPTGDGKTHAGILELLLRNLRAAGILTEDLALPEDPNDLEAIYRGLCRLPRENSRRRRIDFLTIPWHSRGAALLYYTGDDIFNRAMRLKARVMGYSLNQRGLFAGVVRDPHDQRIKTNPGQPIASETEEEIFRVLDVPWQEPHERVRG